MSRRRPIEYHDHRQDRGRNDNYNYNSYNDRCVPYHHTSALSRNIPSYQYQSSDRTPNYYNNSSYYPSALSASAASDLRLDHIQPSSPTPHTHRGHNTHQNPTRTYPANLNPYSNLHSRQITHISHSHSHAPNNDYIAHGNELIPRTSSNNRTSSPWDKSDYQIIREAGWRSKKEFMQDYGLKMHSHEDFEEAREILDEFRRRDVVEGMRGGCRSESRVTFEGHAIEGPDVDEEEDDEEDDGDWEDDMINPSLGVDGCGDYIEQGQLGMRIGGVYPRELDFEDEGEEESGMAEYGYGYEGGGGGRDGGYDYRYDVDDYHDDDDDEYYNEW